MDLCKAGPDNLISFYDKRSHWVDEAVDAVHLDSGKTLDTFLQYSPGETGHEAWTGVWLTG